MELNRAMGKGGRLLPATRLGVTDDVERRGDTFGYHRQWEGKQPEGRHTPCPDVSPYLACIGQMPLCVSPCPSHGGSNANLPPPFPAPPFQLGSLHSPSPSLEALMTLGHLPLSQSKLPLYFLKLPLIHLPSPRSHSPASAQLHCLKPPL